MHTIKVFIDQGTEVVEGTLQAEDEDSFFDAQFPLAAARLLVRMLRAAGITADVQTPDGNILKD